MVRQIDLLGRIVIPAEIRRKLGIEIGDELSFEVKNNSLIIQKVNVLNVAEQIKELLKSEKNEHTREVLNILLNQMEE